MQGGVGDCTRGSRIPSQCSTVMTCGDAQVARQLLPAGSLVATCLPRSRRVTIRPLPKGTQVMPPVTITAVLQPVSPCLSSHLASLCCSVLFLPQLLSPNARLSTPKLPGQAKVGLSAACDGGRRWCPMQTPASVPLENLVSSLN